MKITNDNQLTDQHKPPEEKDVETLPTDLQLPEECKHQLLAAVFPKHYHFTHRALCEIDTKWASIQNHTVKEQTSGGYSRRPDQMARQFRSSKLAVETACGLQNGLERSLSRGRVKVNCRVS